MCVIAIRITICSTQIFLKIPPADLLISLWSISAEDRDPQSIYATITVHEASELLQMLTTTKLSGIQATIFIFAPEAC